MECIEEGIRIKDLSVNSLDNGLWVWGGGCVFKKWIGGGRFKKGEGTNRGD